MATKGVPTSASASASASASPHRVALVAVWGARISWLALAVFGGEAIGDALATRTRAVQLVGTIVAWVAWGVVALALLVPSTVSLTVARTITPAAVVVAILAAVQSGDSAAGVVCVALAVLAAALVVTGELGEVFAQGSAYGDERRFPLRPPVAYLVPAVVSWCLLCAAAISGPLLVASAAWPAGIAVTTVAVVMAWFLGRRYHRLSRRWLVLVPAGVVVHDHLVLGETAMFPRATLDHLGLALAGTDAADLTGPAAGLAVEIGVLDVPTVLLAPTRTTPRGTALHVRSVLVAPTRPGRLLAEAARRNLPVG